MRSIILCEHLTLSCVRQSIYLCILSYQHQQKVQPISFNLKGTLSEWGKVDLNAIIYKMYKCSPLKLCIVKTHRKPFGLDNTLSHWKKSIFLTFSVFRFCPSEDQHSVWDFPLFFQYCYFMNIYAILFLLQIWALQSTTMLVCSLPVKSRKRLAHDVLYKLLPCILPCSCHRLCQNSRAHGSFCD